AGRYVLIDSSSNGTHVTIDGEDEFVLRRDEVTLRGHGWITFGQSMEYAGERVEFFLYVEGRG
ncbi:MAG: adenylate/guanylate cyclase domain-containing protein, partial [Cupriavidus sp.]